MNNDVYNRKGSRYILSGEYKETIKGLKQGIYFVILETGNDRLKTKIINIQ